MVISIDGRDDNLRKPILKQVHNIGKAKVVTIDESIAKRFDISEENNTFLEQEVTENGKGILMRVRNLRS